MGARKVEDLIAGRPLYYPCLHALCAFVSCAVSTGTRGTMALAGFSLKKDRYVALLEKLIGETESLQDNPPKFVPQEDK